MNEQESRDAIAFKMRLGYEFGLLDQSDLKEMAQDWDEDKSHDMRERYKQVVSSVQRLPPGYD